jgi:uncharacterized protein with LGFP repeats
VDGLMAKLLKSPLRYTWLLPGARNWMMTVLSFKMLTPSSVPTGGFWMVGVWALAVVHTPATNNIVQKWRKREAFFMMPNA